MSDEEDEAGTGTDQLDASANDDGIQSETEDEASNQSEDENEQSDQSDEEEEQFGQDEDSNADLEMDEAYALKLLQSGS